MSAVAPMLATAAISSCVKGTQITKPVFCCVTLMPGRPSTSSISFQRILTRSEPRWPVLAASVMTRARCGLACLSASATCSSVQGTWPPVPPGACVPTVIGKGNISRTSAHFSTALRAVCAHFCCAGRSANPSRKAWTSAGRMRSSERPPSVSGRSAKRKEIPIANSRRSSQSIELRAIHVRPDYLREAATLNRGGSPPLPWLHCGWPQPVGPVMLL